jgi:quinol monooxygenase YgiN
MTIAILAVLEAKSDQVGNVTSTLSALIERTREEPGNLSYELFKAEDGTRLVMLEEYADKAAHAAHRETDHYRTYAPRMMENLAEPVKVYYLSETPPE